MKHKHEGEIVSISSHYEDKPVITIALGKKTSAKKKTENSMVSSVSDDRSTLRIPMKAEEAKHCALGDKVYVTIEKSEGSIRDKED